MQRGSNQRPVRSEPLCHGLSLSRFKSLKESGHHSLLLAAAGGCCLCRGAECPFTKGRVAPSLWRLGHRARQPSKLEDQSPKANKPSFSETLRVTNNVYWCCRTGVLLSIIGRYPQLRRGETAPTVVFQAPTRVGRTKTHGCRTWACPVTGSWTVLGGWF